MYSQEKPKKKLESDSASVQERWPVSFAARTTQSPSSISAHIVTASIDSRFVRLSKVDVPSASGNVDIIQVAIEQLKRMKFHVN